MGIIYRVPQKGFSRVPSTVPIRRGFCHEENWRLRETGPSSRQGRQTALLFLFVPLQRNPLLIGPVVPRLVVWKVSSQCSFSYAASISEPGKKTPFGATLQESWTCILGTVINWPIITVDHMCGLYVMVGKKIIILQIWHLKALATFPKSKSWNPSTNVGIPFQRRKWISAAFNSPSPSVVQNINLESAHASFEAHKAEGWL